ncbi:MAG TPA: hypothetical protein VGA70_01610 [Longimicrobiales bacterium]|jgi:hypothetical protein
MEYMIPLLAIFSAVFVPTVGVMLILVSRFALKPLVETLSLALRESQQGKPGSAKWQIQELTEQLEALTAEVRRLQEAQDFDRQLLASGGEGGKGPEGGS